MLGDVNGGAEVIAEGNIVVLGNMRGFAHAGAKGNRSAFVAAEKLMPTQLRIADVIMKHEIVKNDMEYCILLIFHQNIRLKRNRVRQK